MPKIAGAPLAFAPNGGRTDHRARFIARAPGYSAFLTRRGAVLSLEHGARALSLKLAGADVKRLDGARRLPGRVSSFVGSDPKRWTSALPTFGAVRYESAWRGIDVTYHGRDRALEYDFNVAAGADPDQVRIAIGGADGVRLAKDGALVLQVGDRSMRQLAPRAWQIVDGERRAVDVAYILRGRTARISVGDYDKSRPLVIDPVLSYASYLGGSSDDDVRGVAVDSSGAIYVTGSTASANFPKSGDTHQAKDAYITKLSADGTQIVYSTYLGGSNTDTANDIAVGPDGSAYIAGSTQSASTDPNPFPTLRQLRVCHGSNFLLDAWVARLTPAGTGLTWSTCLNGDNVNGTGGGAEGIEVDGSGKAYVGGTATNLLTLAGSADTTQNGNYDGFVTKIRTDGGNTPALDYSTYVGGTSTDFGHDVAIDTSNPPTAYLTGETASINFTTAGSAPYQSSNAGGYDAFVTRIAGAGTSLVYSTYLGGTASDAGQAVAAGPDGVAYVAGDAGGSFPGIGGLSGIDGIVAKIPANGSATGYAAVRVGGSDTDQAYGIATSGSNVFVAGTSFSSNFETSNAVRSKSTVGSGDVFLRKLNSSLSTVYSTFLGASTNNSLADPSVAASTDGKAYVGGAALADGFATANAIDSTRSSGEGFLAIVVPTTASISAGPEGATQDSTPTYNYSGDTGSTFECKIDAASFAACPGTTTGSYTAPSQSPGAHTFYVRQVDSGGTPGPSTTRSFIVDTAAPAPATLQTPAAGSSTGFKPTFVWTPATDQLSGIDHYELVIGGGVVAETSGSCSDCSVAAPTELSEAPHSWHITAVDGAGNRSDSEERSFTVAVNPTAAFTIAPNPVLVGRAAGFDGSSSTDERGSITRYEWDLNGDGTFEVDAATPTASQTYSAAASVPISLRVTDAAGNSTTSTQTLRISTQVSGGTQFGVSINKGAQYTNDPNVKLKVVFPALTSSILVSNDGGFDTPQQFLPLGEINWKLDSSGPERLPKTVYVRFLPSLTAGLTFTDDIILDEIPPKVDAASVTPPAGAAGISKLRKWKLKVKARDSNSGVGFVQATANKRKPGKLIKYKTKLTVKLGTRPKFLRARDKAGNFSKWKKLR